ncbi:MAG: S41 family peptidase [Alistipes sp.]|nr:S41 family peptidase [Alistipes sp.]
MSKRIKHWLSGGAAVVVLGLGSAALQNDFALGQNVEIAVNVMRNIFLYYVDPVDPDALGKGAAAGMVAGLDPYTELIHADESEDFELMTTGKYGGIGSVIRQKGEWVQIAEPYEGSPAARAGLDIGDTFLKVEGRDARGMTTGDVSAVLKGDPGTNVTITVRKFYTGEEQTITVRREVISVPAVTWFGMVADSVGYIRYAEFTDGSSDEIRGAIGALKTRGMRSLVLDLRGNGGGIMQEAVKIAGMFVPRGTEVVSMRGRGEGTSKTYRTESEPLELAMPLAVLVDGYSASAAEIVAGALQDLDRAVVTGQRTFGKGLVQTPVPVGFGSVMKITTAKYYIPSGRCIQAIDYSQGPETDSTGVGRGQRAIPDSLIGEFRTAGGRKVYDGGGVMPDIRLGQEYNSRFAIALYSEGLVDDFADRWSLDNRDSREIAPRTFALTDDDWAGFTQFMAGRKLDYESATGSTLYHLRRVAEYERYLTPEVEAMIDSLSARLKDDTATNLAVYRDEITGLVEDAIVLRRLNRRGVTEHNLAGDKTLDRAIEVLHDISEYRKILTSRDTERK